MPSNSPMQIVFPRLGVTRTLGFRPESRQAEFGSPYSINVRLRDSLTGRLRGGSFTAIGLPVKSDPVYRDRAISFSGNIITAARQGNSSDTALSTDISDTRRPIIFQLSLADAVGGTVVAVVPHKDAYLLCFTATEIWVLAGDPTTGVLRRVSDQVGIVGVNAWCVAHDTVYFLSQYGLYSVGADGSGLKALSADMVPEELTDTIDETAILDYYHLDRGVYIHLTKSPSWFYDTEHGGFWPFEGSTQQSHLLLGPFHIGEENSYGRVQNLQGNMAAGSDDVTWRIVTGLTAEEAAENGKSAIAAAVAGNSYSSYVAASGTWSAGRSHMSYPRTRAIWCCFWLSVESGEWAYEAIAMTRMPSGKWR